MLSGEGNAGERWKTTIGLISKKATLHVQHTFFVHFFAVVFHDYDVKLCFLSLALDLCRPFSRWASLACRLLSLFLGLFLALYSKFVDLTINLSLIL